MSLNDIKGFNLKRRALALALAGTLVLTGCNYRELAPEETRKILGETDQEDDKSKKDITIKDGEEFIVRGLIETLDVPGETFKLVAEFRVEDDDANMWRITANKKLRYSIRTEGLPSDTEVFVDNVHIDTCIRSRFASIDGIPQDTMDDRVHSSMTYGFSIGNNAFYHNTFSIEGCNDSFIQATITGYNGYSEGTLEEKRFTEDTYREMGVYGSGFDFVIDLLVKGPNDKHFRGTSADTEFVVRTTDELILYQQEEDGKIYIKEKNGNYKEYKPAE